MKGSTSANLRHISSHNKFENWNRPMNLGIMTLIFTKRKTFQRSAKRIKDWVFLKWSFEWVAFLVKKNPLGTSLVLRGLPWYWEKRPRPRTQRSPEKKQKSATKWNGGGVFDSTKKLQKKCESWIIFGGDLKISDRIHPYVLLKNFS